MKRKLLYTLSCFLFFVLFVACESLSSEKGNIYSANPNVLGLGDNVSLFTAKSTANPNMDYDAKKSADCVACHFDKSINIASSKHSVKDDFKGELCVTCHGTNGDKHYSKIYLSPEDCGVCHIKSEVNRNPLNEGFVNNFISSSHAKLTNSDKFLDKAKKEGYLQTFNGQTFLISKGGCLKCHENISFQNFVADKAYFMTASGEKVFGNLYIADNLSVGLSVVDGDNEFIGMTCSTCHDMHNGKLTKKDEYTLCTSCHVVDDMEIAKLDDKHKIDINSIVETHFGKDGVGGYNIDMKSKRACTLCHDSHANTSFDGRNVVKLTKDFATTGMADFASKSFNHQFEKECIRCHDGYEAAKSIEGVPDKYLDNSTRKTVAVGCVTCHSLTYKPLFGIFGYRLGETRESKSDTFTFFGNLDPKLDVIPKSDMKQLGDSFLCLTCHDGVETARVITDDMLNKPFNHKESAHPGAAGGIFWGNVAYQFEGKSYAQGQFPAHATNRKQRDGSFMTEEQIAAKSITTITSCVDCHEIDRFSHSLESVNKDDNGTIISINMTESKIDKGCNEDACHGADGIKHGSKAGGNQKAYLQALEDVKQELLKKDIQFDERRQRFVYASNPKVEIPSWSSKDLLGVATNYYILKKCDAGAYSHNPIYVKQILWDMMSYLGGEFSQNAQMFTNDKRP